MTRISILLLVSCLGAIPQLAAGAAVTVIGPGPVDAPLRPSRGDFRILAGTEVVSHTFDLVFGGQTLAGHDAAFSSSANIDFQGGRIEGATVTTQPGVQSAIGGRAINLTSPFRGVVEFQDGVYRGGSVVIDSPTPANAAFRGAPAISIAGSALPVIKIYGGLFEAGVVVDSAAPNVILSRAFALELKSNVGTSVDVYGGEFLGGVQFAGRAAVKIHGTEFNVLPPPLSGFIPGHVDVIVTGKYANGTPFTHLISNARNESIRVFTAGDTLYLQAPEPAASTLAAICCALPALIRRSSAWRSKPA